MLSPAQSLVAQDENWDFIELWLDPIIFPPRILMLVGRKEGICQIYDATANYQPLFTSNAYDEAHSWLVEDDYECINGRILSIEVL